MSGRLYSPPEEAFKRCLSELQRCIYYFRIVQILDEEPRNTIGIDFLALARIAFYDQMVAHAIKVFDRDSKSVTYWQIAQNHADKVGDIEVRLSFSSQEVRRIAEGLRLIRSKTHFHIDRVSVINPTKIWKDAGVTWDDIERLAKFGYAVVEAVYFKQFGLKKPLQDYYGNDLREIMKLADANGYPFV